MKEIKGKGDTTARRQGAPQLIAAETNLLRLPIFSLARRSSTLVAIECTGATNRGGERTKFRFRVARNAITSYPGTLARSAHMAFLSMIKEQGLPFENPLGFTWGELIRRLGISRSGNTQRILEQAILATKGLTIFTDYGLYSKADGRFIQARSGLSLYSQITFTNERLPDGGIADKNYLWFSPWYLSNLNALYTVPVDYELWRVLDEKSHIASRLYELFLVKFHRQGSSLDFAYTTLAQLLPLQPKRYVSQARQQLEPALSLLQEKKLLNGVTWRDAKNPNELAVLQFHRGDLLSAERTIALPEPEEETETLEVTEVHVTPESIVEEFYELWGQRKQQTILKQPTRKDTAQASKLLKVYGPEKLQQLLPLAVEKMGRKWPDAKTFTAVLDYIPEAAKGFDDREARNKQERQIRRQGDLAEKRELAREKSQRQEIEAFWNALSEAEQQEHWRSALDKASTWQRKELKGEGMLAETIRKNLLDRHILKILSS